MYSIQSEIYTDIYFNYKNILTINTIPDGPLINHTKQINIQQKTNSKFKTNNAQNKCVYALYNINNELYTLDTISDFFLLCKQNGYIIDTQLTQMVNNQKQLNSIICYISYN